MATYRYTNTAVNGLSLKLNERPLYGSSRLGSLRKEEELHSLPAFDPVEPHTVQQVDLNYEFTDHLGNVCAVVTGRLLDGNGGGTPKQAELLSAQGYEPFGSLLPGRNFSSSSYRFGFNGKEKDDEVHGSTGTSYDFGARMYDDRAGRFLSLDPYAAKEPGETPYGFAGNSPVMFVDHNGEYKMSRKLQREYPVLTNLIKNLESLATVDPRVWDAFKTTMGLTEEQARSVVRWGEGPKLKVRDLKSVVRADDDPRPNVKYAQSRGGLDGRVTFNKKMVDILEGTREHPDIAPADAASLVFVTALHEPQHLADKEINGHLTRGREPGNEFEMKAFGKDYGTDNAKEFGKDQPDLQRNILEKSGIPRESETKP